MSKFITMKMMKSWLLVVFWILFSNLSIASIKGNTNNFYLNGEIIGQITGKVVLSYQNENGLMYKDTTLLIDGYFKFSGFITQPTMVSLRGDVKNQGDADVNATSFFIEPNQTISIFLKKNKFKEVVIKGSKTQIEFETYNKNTKDLDFDQLVKYNYDYITNHRNSYVSVFIFHIFKQFWSVDSCFGLYNNLSSEIKNSIIGKEVIKELNVINSATSGNEAFNFRNLSIKNKEIKLSDFKDKVVLLDFWASWCLPCRKGNPNLIRLFEKYHDKGFEIISISSDDNISAWKAAIEKDKISAWYHTLSDIYKEGKVISTNDNIGKKYGIQVLPTQILIDRNGNIIKRFDSEESINLLERHLKTMLELK